MEREGLCFVIPLCVSFDFYVFFSFSFLCFYIRVCLFFGLMKLVKGFVFSIITCLSR